MRAVRAIYETTSDKLTIDIPKSLQHHKVEVIVLPIEEEKTAKTLDWVGSWEGEHLVREPQGEYEVRKKLK